MRSRRAGTSSDPSRRAPGGCRRAPREAPAGRRTSGSGAARRSPLRRRARVDRGRGRGGRSGSRSRPASGGRGPSPRRRARARGQPRRKRRASRARAPRGDRSTTARSIRARHSAPPAGRRRPDRAPPRPRTRAAERPSPTAHSSLEHRDALHVRGLREHVDRLHAPQRIAGLDHLGGVRRQGRGVAGDVDDPRGIASITLRTIFFESPARGGSTTMTSGGPASSISGRTPSRASAADEGRVVDRVRGGVLLGVGDRVGDALQPPDLAGASGRSRARSSRCRRRGRRRARRPAGPQDSATIP